MNKKCVFITGLTEEQAKKLYGFLEKELYRFDYEVWNNDYYDDVLSLMYDKVRKKILKESVGSK